MADREARERLAGNLTRFVTGRITNLEFETENDRRPRELQRARVLLALPRPQT